MAGRKPLTMKADDDLAERIERYQDKRGLDNRTDAMEQLIETGLRESSPVVSRLKDRAFEAGFYLGLVAIVVAIASLTTELLTVATGLQVATILVAVGVSAIAAVESVRLLRLRVPAWVFGGDS